MPMEPNKDRQHVLPEQVEYRRRQAEKAKKRQQRKNQKLIFLGICALGVVLLVVCVVLIFNAIFGKKTPASSSSSIPSSVSVSQPGTGVTWPTAQDPNVWNLKLVNAQKPLEPGYTFEEGSVAQDKVAYYFDARAVDALKQMMTDCNSVEGHSLAIISGRRGETTQTKKHNAVIAELKAQGMDEAQAVAMAHQIEPPAGQSEHQIGLAVDFITATVQQPGDAFAQTPEYQWLLANAANYGFILRYPENKVNITGMLFSPYHFRYVGVEDATIISQAGISLEEYLTDVSGVISQPVPTEEGTESQSTVPE